MPPKRKLEARDPEEGKLRRSPRHKSGSSTGIRDFVEHESKISEKEKKGKEKGDSEEKTAETSGEPPRRNPSRKTGSPKRVVRDFIELEHKSKEKEKEKVIDEDHPVPVASTGKRKAEYQDSGQAFKKQHLLPKENEPTPEAPTSKGPAESQAAEKFFNAEELEKMQKEFEYTTNSNFNEIKPSLLAFSHEQYKIILALRQPLPGEKEQLIPQSFLNAIAMPVDLASWQRKLPPYIAYIEGLDSAHDMDSQQLQKQITQIKSAQKQMVPLVDYLLARYESAHKDPGELGKVCRQFVERIKGLESTRDKNDRLRLYQSALLHNRHELDRLKEDVKAIGDNINTTNGMSLMVGIIQGVFSNLYIIDSLLHREYPVLRQEAIKSIDRDKRQQILDNYTKRVKNTQGLSDNQAVVSLWEYFPSIIRLFRDDNMRYTQLTERATNIEKQDRVSIDRVPPAGDQQPGDEEMSEEDKFSETKKNIDTIRAKIKELGSRLNGVTRIEAKRTCALMRNLMHKKESAREVDNLEELHAVTTQVLKMLQGEDIQAIQDFYVPFDGRQLKNSLITRHPRLPENENNAFEVAREISQQSLRKQRKQEVQEKEPDPVEEVIAEINQRNAHRFLKAGQTLDKLPLKEAATYLAQIATTTEGKTMFVFDVDQTLIQTGTDWVVPGTWIRGIELLLQMDCVVTLITGRKIETIDTALDKAGSRGSALKDKLEICGERGSMRRGPKTHGEKILTNKRSEKYVPLVEHLAEDLKSALNEDQTLNNYRERNLVPQEVPVTDHALGATILGKTFDDVQGQVAQQAEQDKSIDVEETFSAICVTIEDIVKGVLKKYPEFKASRRLGLEIQLNPEVTGIHLDKGDAMGQVYKDYSDVSSILVFADGQIDIPMVQRAQELATLRKLLGIYLSQQQRDKRIGFLKGVLSQLQKRYDTILTKEEVEKIVNAFKISFMEENEISLQGEDIQKIIKRHAEGTLEATRRHAEGTPEAARRYIEDMQEIARKCTEDIQKIAGKYIEDTPEAARKYTEEYTQKITEIYIKEIQENAEIHAGDVQMAAERHTEDTPEAARKYTEDIQKIAKRHIKDIQKDTRTYAEDMQKAAKRYTEYTSEDTSEATKRHTEDIQKIAGKYTEDIQKIAKRRKYIERIYEEYIARSRIGETFDRDEIEKIVTDKNALNEELHSLHNSKVQNYAFIAVECPRQSEELLALATMKVKGPKEAAELVFEIASSISNIYRQ